MIGGMMEIMVAQKDLILSMIWDIRALHVNNLINGPPSHIFQLTMELIKHILSRRPIMIALLRRSIITTIDITKLQLHLPKLKLAGGAMATVEAPRKWMH